MTAEEKAQLLNKYTNAFNKLSQILWDKNPTFANQTLNKFRMIQEIKQLRTTIDGLAQLTKELIGDLPTNEDKILFGKDFKGFPTEETKKATDSLLLAKAWLKEIEKQLK